MPDERIEKFYMEPRTGERVVTEWAFRNWNHSKRDARTGKLVLEAHPYLNHHYWIKNRKVETGYEYWAPHKGRNPYDVSYDFISRMNSADARSYARFRGKLYKGAAALGVTLGSFKQSRDMVVNRYNLLNEKADLAIARAARELWTPKKAASLHLEIIFGWTPLLTDIHAATTSVIELANVRGTISASVTDTWHDRPNANWQDIEMKVRSTRSAMYTVSNPNTWLAERAGLLNPAAVAWDLVPWSFVVNMFVSTGQLVNSITDFAGLAFDNDTVTRTCSYRGTWDAASLGKATQFMKGVDQRREFGADQRPPLVFRLPEVNWYTASMAASLFTQKIGKISGLVSKTFNR